MAFFYFDESIHTRAGFILGAHVASTEDLSAPVTEALQRAGLRPGIDEYKSGARMSTNPSMIEARDELHEVVKNCKVGVVIVPSDRRQDVGVEAMRGLRKILVSTGIGLRGNAIFLDEGLVESRPRFEALVGDLGLSQNMIATDRCHHSGLRRHCRNAWRPCAAAGPSGIA